MTEEKIRSAACAITSLAGYVTPEHWDILSNVRCELLDAADQVHVYESVLPAGVVEEAVPVKEVWQ